LGKIVFENSDLRSKLEEIVHPVVADLIKKWVAAAKSEGKRAVVVNAALLHECGLRESLDLVVILRASLATRVARARVRDGLSRREILARFAAQKDFPWTKAAAAKFFSPNTDIRKVGTDCGDFRPQILELIEGYSEWKRKNS
jgi:dephospho-CoA kinase